MSKDLDEMLKESPTLTFNPFPQETQEEFLETLVDLISDGKLTYNYEEDDSFHMDYYYIVNCIKHPWLNWESWYNSLWYTYHVYI